MSHDITLRPVLTDDRLGLAGLINAHSLAVVGTRRALTAVVLAEFHRRGIRRMITDTDNASFTGANRLYPRFGFHPYRFEHVYEKQLLPGTEWRALSVSDFYP